MVAKKRIQREAYDMENGTQRTHTAVNDLLRDAEAELNAFYSAVRIDQGSAAAVLAAGFWLCLFGKAEISNTQKQDLRRISIRAADLWAANLAAESRVTRDMRDSASERGLPSPASRQN